MHECMDGWMGGWVDGWMGGWVDGWMDGCVRVVYVQTGYNRFLCLGCVLCTYTYIGTQMKQTHPFDVDGLGPRQQEAVVRPPLSAQSYASKARIA